MRAGKPLAVAVLIVSVLQHAAGADARPDGATRCRMLKLSAIAVHAHAHVRCHARAIGFGMSVVPACLASADAKLARAFARAEDAGDCPPDPATARTASESFVAQALALTRPAPTPTPTPSPAFTGCGNGVVEAGEQCDGQAFCQPTCRFVLPTVCCGQSGFCIDGEFPFLAENCFAQGIPYVLGALCTTTDDACEPGLPCAGACTPEATFPAISVCCDAPSGCIETIADDTIDLWQFLAQSCLQVSGSVSVGTCAPSGGCVPGG